MDSIKPCKYCGKEWIEHLSVEPLCGELKKKDEVIAKCVEVLGFYADEDGGPYASNDYHTADGGEKAIKLLTELKKERVCE